MAPPSFDFSDDIGVSATNVNASKSSYPSQRTLLLAPPSVASHPSALTSVLEAHERTTTDIQMLDRLALGLVSLPAATYDLVLLLTDVDGSRTESQRLFGREAVAKAFEALKAGGKLRSQDGSYPIGGTEFTESILAGLVRLAGADGVEKPVDSGVQSMPLRFGRKVGQDATTPINGKRKGEDLSAAAPIGVGFSDDLDDLDALEDDDAELVDENDLLTEEDKARPVMPPPECQPKAGKRRRACKDCTCGLAAKIEAEDRAKRQAAETALNELHSANGETASANGGPNALPNGQPATAKLAADDLIEQDFTVQGKVGSCGNCALGDAFRCDGCPYIGLPAFKPGEEVRLMNDEVQL